MKKVFTIFSIVLLMAIASCGRKSTKEQAAADSIAAAAAADSIAAVEAADGEILIISYELFKNDGYNGSFQQFKKLLAQNPEALNDMYTLYSNRKGYTGDLRSYLKLIEIVPEASPEELRVLYDVLFEAKETTYTYDEFSVAWKEQVRFKDYVFDLVYNNNLYWSEREIFFQKYYSSNIFLKELYDLLTQYDNTYPKDVSFEDFKIKMEDYDYAQKIYLWLSSNVSFFPNSSTAKSYYKKLEIGGGFKSKGHEYEIQTEDKLLADSDIYLFTAFALILFSIFSIILIRKSLKAIFVKRKLQDYFLMIIAISSFVFGLFILISSTIIQFYLSGNKDEEILFGILSSFIGAIFLIALHKRKFVDFILFFISLGSLSFSILLFNSSSSDREVSPFFLMLSVFILFVLWKDNFFTKEPRNTPLDGTREKGKEMLDELRKMGLDQSMVGKTVIKKASVKKEEDKNSTEK